jgi:hypothetical protein
MTMFRLCLPDPTGKIAKVRRYWASTDEGALAMAREMLSEDPTLISFELWDGHRKGRRGAEAGGHHSARSQPSRFKTPTISIGKGAAGLTQPPR